MKLIRFSTEDYMLWKMTRILTKGVIPKTPPQQQTKELTATDEEKAIVDNSSSSAPSSDDSRSVKFIFQFS